jgi:rhomboid protease GluP
MNQQRIISYANNDLCFSDIRSDLENALSIENSSLTNRFYDKYIKNKPTFAILFAIINIAIFIGIELFASIEQANYLYNFACMKWYSILEYGEYYRLFTCMFMHFGLTHLSSNMISLVALGSQLEPDIGHLKFIIIYIVSGLCASLTSLYYHAQMEEPVISAGASGAIYGLFGAYVIYSLFGKLKGNVAATKIALISVLMLLNGMSSVSIDNAAHLGGIISGCLIAFICCICSKNKI